MNLEIPFKETEYGFDWGAASVTRTASYKGQVVITIETPKAFMHIRVTKSGIIRANTYKKNEKR